MTKFKRKLFNIALITFLCFAFNNTISLAAAEKTSPKSQQSPIETTAASAILMDQNGKILYKKEPHKRLPPASVTKIMTLLLAVEAVEEGKISLDDKVSTSENAWRQGGSQIWLEPGETMTVKEILTAIAVVSANDAAVAILERIYGSEQQGVEAMNERAKSLGLENTHFSNANGLPEAKHYMSVYDAALIAREALKHPLYMELCSIKEHWLRDGKNWLVNTNKLLWWYNGADGLKTGWTEDAQYCFVGTAKRGDLRLISVVFATPEPRSHLRESMKILDWGYNNFAAEPIVKQGTVIERLKISKGVEKELELVAAEDLILTVVKGHNKNLQKKVVVEKNAVAPVKSGEKYGQLLVLKEGQQIGSVDLVAGYDVPRAGFVKIFRNMIGSLFGS